MRTESIKKKLEFDYDITAFRKARIEHKHQHILLGLATDYMNVSFSNLKKTTIKIQRQNFDL